METSAPPPPTEQSASTTEDKTVAVVSYLTLIGFIIAIVIHTNKKTKLGAFHLRQMLGLILTQICLSVILIIPILGWIAFPLLMIGIFVLWIMGLLAALKGELKPLPLLGAYYQQWFGNLFD